MTKDGYLPLFETKEAKGRIPFMLYIVSVFVGIFFICVYRVSHSSAKGEVERWAWKGMFLSELWFILYWVITLVPRWQPVYRYTFKDRLSYRYEKDLPKVDVFVCTADPILEPPLMVVNTVLSVMAYDYPPEKLSVYLSDDGGSEVTFYALLEASRFSEVWLPFCRKFKIEPRSPAAYFSTALKPVDDDPLIAKEWSSVKSNYEDMKNRVESAAKKGQISENIRKEHKGFSEWDMVISRRDHQTILQILIDGRDSKAMDIEGQPLPTLVYLSREKRPNFHHQFKAGAMNALIRVSSGISNGSIILNVDCDMYSNNSKSVRDALCFFMDEEKGHEIAYVQFPQTFENLTKNDIYGSSLRVILKVDLAGFDGNGGPCYIGTGCFHRRETLCGKIFNSNECKGDWLRSQNDRKVEESAIVLEESCKALANCAYEENTQWGKEMGLKYGCPVEDIITGLSIQRRGWKSIYFMPERDGFLGLAPTTLLQTLVQHKRWSEGDFQILLSRYCPFIYGHKRMPFKLQLSYCIFLPWAANCWATLYYVSVPSLCLLKGFSLFPGISSLWVLPFAYVFTAGCAHDFSLFHWSGGTVRGWWNDQRMWLFKRTTSYLFGFCDTILKLLGIAESAFVVTAKVADEDVSQRYEQEIIEFGASSPMFTILSTLAMINLFSLVGAVKTNNFNPLALQTILCGLLVVINLPVYQGLFFRKDKGRLPATVKYQSLIVALLACSIALY